ncbi:uncharacterized protein [Oscarella lobularis]|uniref:uncharacterized protein isoform X2 n=1 Tax=Oscarella lobularis TaxID=121494 RepID=UPI0033137919
MAATQEAFASKRRKSYSTKHRMSKIEEDLGAILSRLKEDIREANNPTETSNLKPSSVITPKDTDYYRRERDHALERLKSVPTPEPLFLQVECFLKELESCLKSEYSENSLPLLLHQFFTDRVEQLLMCKHMHQLRWVRFSGYNSIAEGLMPTYLDRIKQVVSELNDSVERARRLSVARDNVLGNSSTTPSVVTKDDLAIYTRSLVCEMFATKRVSFFLKILKWIHLSNRKDFANVVVAPGSKTDPRVVRRKWKTVINLVSREKRSCSMDGDDEETCDVDGEEAMWKLMRELPPFSLDGVPRVTANVHADLKVQLSYLANCYGISMPDNLGSAANELELFYNVNRKFKIIFQQQEERLTFLDYNEETETHAHAGEERIFKKVESRVSPAAWPRSDEGFFDRLSYLKVHFLSDADELLAILSNTLTIGNVQKLQFGLKRFSAEMQKPRFVPDAAAKVWDNILSGIDPHDPTFSPPVNASRSTGHDKRKKRSGGFDFGSAVQLLEEKDDIRLGRQAGSDCKNALTAFLYLRHLRIRDLRTKCLNLLNYFRSVRRTLLFYETRESSGNSAHKRSGDKTERHFVEPQIYKHNSVTEFTLASDAFLETEEADTISDYYISKPDGALSVKDSRGFSVMYDSALRDFRDLERELLLTASFYVRKAEQKADTSAAPVDRYGVLFDLWSEEALYLESKSQLVGCYMEAFQNTFARTDRKRLSRLVTDVFLRRPKFDPTSEHFVTAYREESTCLQLEKNLMKKVLNEQIDRQRVYIQKIRSDSSSTENDFGLPFNSVEGRLISVHSDRSQLKPLNLFEFHPSLSLCTLIQNGISQAFKEILCLFDVKSPTVAVLLHRELLEIAWKSWDVLDVLSISRYSREIQSNIFSSKFIEDPHCLEKVAANCESSGEFENAIVARIRLLEVIWNRQRLMEIAVETNILHEIYQDLAREIGFGTFHAFVRPASIEKVPAAVKDVLMSGTGDSSSDRYVPSAFSLAVCDIVDDKDIVGISFARAENLIRLLKSDGLENLRRVLMAQTATRHVLIVGIQVSQMLLMEAHAPKDPVPTDSDGDSNSAEDYLRRFHVFFLSVQQIKSQARYCASVEYRKKVASLRDSRELMKLKRDAIGKYCREVTTKLASISLRVQIFHSYYGLRNALSEFPLVRDTYFERSQYALEDCGIDEGTLESKSCQKPFLSSDGKRIMNLWYIPNFLEMMTMFKNLDEKEAAETLQQITFIVSSLYSLMSYFIAETQIFSSVSKDASDVRDASWKDQEGLASRVQDFQDQLSSLRHPLEYSALHEFLKHRVHLCFLSFYVAVFQRMKDSCLSTGREETYYTISSGLQAFLTATTAPSLSSELPNFLILPEPAVDATAEMFPWRSFCSCLSEDKMRLSVTTGLRFSLTYCFFGIGMAERKLAQGEMLNLSLEGRELAEKWTKEGGERTFVEQSLIRYLSLTVQGHALQEEWAKLFLGVRSAPASSRQYQAYMESLESLLQLQLTKKRPTGEALLESDRIFQALQGKVDILTQELETAMIEETYKRLDKQHDLMLAERIRGDGNLPLDLWQAKTEDTCLIPLPSFVEECANSLFQFCGESSLSREKLEVVVENLASRVMQREKLVFNSYSSFYDSILRQLYKTLRLKDAENQRLRSDVERLNSDSSTDLQFHLLDKAQSLFSEITSLRTKISLLEKKLQKKETLLSEEMRSSYSRLVQKLSASSEGVKTRYENFRGELYDDVLKTIHSVRTAALQGMQKIKGKRAVSIEGKDMDQLLVDVEDSVDLQKENGRLLNKVVQLRHGQLWNRAAMRAYYEKKLDDVRQELNDSKLAFLEFKMMKDEEVVSTSKKIKCLQKSLKEMEESQQSLKKHLAEERAIHARKLHEMKTSSVSQMVDKQKDDERDQLIHELEAHRVAVKELSEMMGQSAMKVEHEKSRGQKVTRRLVQQVQQERLLKREAFSKVADLQEQVSEFEHHIVEPSLSAQSLPGFGQARPMQQLSRPSTSLGYLSQGSTMSLLPGQLRRPKSTGSRLFSDAYPKQKPPQRQSDAGYEVDLKLY